MSSRTSQDFLRRIGLDFADFERCSKNSPPHLQPALSWCTIKAILDFGFWILDFGFWILDFGFEEDLWWEKSTSSHTAHSAAGLGPGVLVLHAWWGLNDFLKGDYTASAAAFQFHLAARDDYVAESGVKKLRKSLQAAGRAAEFHTYPGTGHWFFESDRPDAFQPAAAELAWQRVVEFLSNYIA